MSSTSASGVRAAAGRTNNSSSARCTIVPLVVATPGGSGSFSMLEKRNCIGHDVNDDTRDGDNDIGTGKVGAGTAVSVMSAIVDGGCHRDEASRTSSAIPTGSMNGVKWFQASFST